MSLKDLFKPKKSEEPSIIKTDDGNVLTSYNQAWLGRIALHKGYIPNQNVGSILKELNINYGMCPMAPVQSSDYKCPCKDMRLNGVCKCGLFKTIPPRRIGGGTSSASIKRND